jgi:UDP-N-acetylmuramyl pentapeptide phosphotransferase/UDP-N-acetylglucosamine-1-phosphate transferase
MVSLIVLLGIAVASGAASWWLTGKLANREAPLLPIDHPNERSLHQIPTPRTGGLAIMMSFVVGLVGLAAGGGWPASHESASVWGWSTSTWIVGLTLVLAVVSFCDDYRGLPIAVRLASQVAAACIVVIGSRLAPSGIQVPLLGTIEFGWLSLALAIIFLVWMTNLYNFMDGMDGFAGGMTLLGCSLLASLAWQGKHETVLALAALLAGAALGFLIYNFPPARIFMGDVGSVPAGFLIGSLILMGCRDGLFSLWVPLIIFSPFIVDATVTLIRRACCGERLWAAHRNHYYQRVVLLGWGHRKTVLAEYALMMLCGALAWGYQLGDDQGKAAILGAWGALMIVALLSVHLAERLTSRVQVEV